MSRAIPAAATAPPIPFVVLGGWLGAGKTTLLNRLLAETTERIAVIVNDIGEINIDRDLVAAASEDVIELTNGCVCCSIGASLAITLRDLTRSDPRPERIVLEASGVADPSRAARYGDRSVVPLDAVITVVDAADIVARLADPVYGSLVRSQIEVCDLAVLSKLDTVDRAAGGAALAAVEAIGRGAVAPADDTPGWVAWMLANTLPGPAALQAGEAGPFEDSLPEPPSVATALWAFEGPVDPEVVEARLLGTEGLLRAKGFIATPQGPMLVQAAGRRVSLSTAAAHAAHLGRLVVLTRSPRPEPATDEPATEQQQAGHGRGPRPHHGPENGSGVLKLCNVTAPD